MAYLPLPQYIIWIRDSTTTTAKIGNQQTCPILSTEALKVLLPFSSSYICEVGFSAMVGMKTKLRNKLQLSNSLRLKITRIDVDVNAVINSNRKQGHQSHTPHYEKQQFFVNLYSIINKNIFSFLELLFYPVKLCGSR
jgi:hypothetical protein